MLPEFIEDLILPGKELLGDRPDPEHFSPTKMMTLWDTVLGELRVVGGHPWQKYRCLNSLRVLLEEQGDVYGYGLCPYTGQIVVSEAVKGRFFFFPLPLLKSSEQWTTGCTSARLTGVVWAFGGFSPSK